MSPAPRWGPAVVAEGPYRIQPGDVTPLNQVFSDAFTERYRRDGLVGVREPFLNPAIWRYAIDHVDEGAMPWCDERHVVGELKIAHR